MKLSLWLLGAFAAVSKVLADENDFTSPANEQYEEVQLNNYSLDYFIEENEEASASESTELFYGETITLNYDLVNNEDTAITIVGLGGAFRDPLTGEPLVNMTANSVDPLIVEPNSSGKVRQKINLEFLPSDYILAPIVYVAYQDQLKGLQARGQLVNVVEPPVSIFNPKLLFLELIFFGSIGYVVYAFYGTSIAKYFQEPVEETKKGKSSATASGVDSSWLPKTHLQQQKKTKSRKAY